MTELLTDKARRTRANLLDQAERHFGRGGTNGARLDEIATEAGVAKSLVFRYWDSKEALFSEVNARATERYRGYIEHAALAPDFATDPVRGTTGAAVDFFASYPETAWLFNPILAEPPFEAHRPEVDALGPTLASAAARLGGSPEAERARELVDDLVLGTIRGPMGTVDPGDRALLTDCLSAAIEGGLAHLRPLPAVPARRPRRTRPAPLHDGTDGREATRSQILDAALQVFSEQSFDDARLEDIAAIAHVAKASIFTHWPSKLELFLDLRRLLMGDVQRAVLTAIAPLPTFSARVDEVVATMLDFHYAHPRYQPVLLPRPGIDEDEELQTLGVQWTIEGVERFGIPPTAIPVLPIAASIAVSAVRTAIRAMHSDELHPVLVKAVAQPYIFGAVRALAERFEVPFDGAEAVINSWD